MKKFARAFGFFLILLGIFAAVVSLIGINVTLLTWIDFLGEGWGFIFKLLIALIGFVILAISNIDVEKENAEQAIQ